jgi:glycosyltransferase involved in cell wall biosynthesis
MRILTALTYYRPHYSGLTVYSERVARALAERGHQVTVLTSRFNPALPAHEQADGVEIIRPTVWLRISKGVIMPAMPYWAWKLSRQADIVHLHVPQLDAAPIALLARALGKPVVLTYHCDLRLPEGFVNQLANRASDLSNHFTARAASRIVHTTADYAQHSPFLHRYLDKLTTIYTPIELPEIGPEKRAAFRQKHNLQPGQRIIGMAARLATEKGVEYLARAMPLVLERYPQARVLYVGPYQNVVGEAEYSRRVMGLIEPLRQQWDFLGVVSNEEMAAFFQECEVLVLPSLNSTESFGMVQVEAIASGTPVIASDLPGMRVPVQESGAGIIVPPADAPALARAIIAILEQPGNFQGRPERLLQQSSTEAVATAYESLFEGLALHKTQIAQSSTRTLEVGEPGRGLND